jgi:D-arginine dehydrogenase
MTETAEAIVLGGGMAGSALAFELAATMNVIMLEWESQPGYHSTGRSAAMLIDSYGGEVVCGLTRASRAFLEAPPDGFVETPLLSPRGFLHVARPDQAATLEELEAELPPGTTIRRVDDAEIARIAPLIAPGYAAGGLYDPDARAIDVAALHQGFLKGFRQRGGKLVTYACTNHIQDSGGNWRIDTAAGDFEAPLLIDATGAWADQVAILAGIQAIGLVPKRRSAVLIDPPSGIDPASLPMINDVDEEFYVKPEGAALMVSPQDETPTPPTDAQPEDLDIAIAVDHYQRLTGQEVRTIGHRWAGLRSFVQDHNPVVGHDPAHSGFFWVAGLGGFGIMTAPAIGSLGAALINGATLTPDLQGLADALSPARLRAA